MLKMLILALMALLLAPMAVGAEKTNPEETSKEYGWVHWYTNLDDAVKIAEEAKKPIFLQFQEIPG